MKKPTEKAKKTTSKATKPEKEAKETKMAAGEEAHEAPVAKKKAKREEPAAVQAQPKKSCRIKSCKREYRAKGYCSTHYRKWRQGAYGRARYTCCSDYGCFKPQGLGRHGYCEEHFQNYYVKGMEVTKVPVAAPAPAAAPAKAEEKAAS